jgi:hypothetical protein
VATSRQEFQGVVFSGGTINATTQTANWLTDMVTNVPAVLRASLTPVVAMSTTPRTDDIFESRHAGLVVGSTVETRIDLPPARRCGRCSLERVASGLGVGRRRCRSISTSWQDLKEAGFQTAVITHQRR